MLALDLFRDRPVIDLTPRRDRGFADSPVEGAGFEPPVPLGEATVRDRFASF
jgi:hypothetical protein